MTSKNNLLSAYGKNFKPSMSRKFVFCKLKSIFMLDFLLLVMSVSGFAILKNSLIYIQRKLANLKKYWISQMDIS